LFNDVRPEYRIDYHSFRFAVDVIPNYVMLRRFFMLEVMLEVYEGL
jgi:hypothetical protein